MKKKAASGITAGLSIRTSLSPGALVLFCGRLSILTIRRVRRAHRIPVSGAPASNAMAGKKAVALLH
jgi:hypothetical protein